MNVHHTMRYICYRTNFITAIKIYPAFISFIIRETEPKKTLGHLTFVIKPLSRPFEDERPRLDVGFIANQKV